MGQSLEAAKRHAQRFVEDFNKRFTPNTPCFYQPTRGLDKWYPTRTRSEAWVLGHGEPVVQIDGSSGCVSIEHLRMPGSAHYEAAKREADQVWEDWVDELVAVVADNAPVPAKTPEDTELAVYHYAISVATPRGEIQHDGILVVPKIETFEDYLRCRAEMASDVGATPELIQVRSMSLIGAAPAAAPAPAQEAAQ